MELYTFTVSGLTKQCVASHVHAIEYLSIFIVIQSIGQSQVADTWQAMHFSAKQDSSLKT